MRIERRCAPGGPHHRTREIQLLTRTGDPDIGKASLFFQLGGITKGSTVREYALFHAGEKDDRKLQSLGGVQRHECHDAAVLIGNLVRIGHQRHLLEEVTQGAVGIGLAIFLRHRLQFGEIFDAGLVLRVT